MSKTVKKKKRTDHTVQDEHRAWLTGFDDCIFAEELGRGSIAVEDGLYRNKRVLLELKSQSREKKSKIPFRAD